MAARNTNTISAATLKRRGMAALEEALRHGPVHIVKHNKPAAVVLSEDEYARLAGGQAAPVAGLSALQWLLAHAPSGSRSKQHIDEALDRERAW